MLLAPLLDPPLVDRFYTFQGIDDRKTKRIFFIKFLIRTLQPSTYRTLRAIIGHLSRLSKKSVRRTSGLVKPLAFCLTWSGEVQSMLLVHLILGHASSIFASHRPPSQVDNVMTFDDWHHFYSLSDKDIQSVNGKDVETQILLHEIVKTVRRTNERLHALQTFHRSPALHALDGSHEERLGLQKLFKIAEQLNDVYTFLSKQLQIRQQEEGPWITGFSDIFAAWVWVFKSIDIHWKYFDQINITRNAVKIADINAIAIADNPLPGEDSHGGPLLECLMSPVINIRRCRMLLRAIFDNMWGKTRWGLLQIGITAEQDEHDQLMNIIENLDPCAYHSNFVAGFGDSDMIIEQNKNAPIISQFHLHSPDRMAIYEGSVYMSTTHNKLKIIKAVEGRLYDDFFILAHRRWEKRKTHSANIDVTYIIKDSVSCHKLIKRSVTDTRATRSHCRSTINFRSTSISV